MSGVWADKGSISWKTVLRPEFAFPESKKLFPSMVYVICLIPSNIPLKKFVTHHLENKLLFFNSTL
jgi:hypothetical protein